MHIHLVTYATPSFRKRQIILGWSARLNGVVDYVTAWTPEKSIKDGFYDVFKDINLNERGSGFWAWKPYIIADKLSKIPDGDIVFYCDVGRKHQFKELAAPIQPILEWMESIHQDIMPGVYIPWHGPMSKWTKRDAFFYTDRDRADFWEAIPIQASFSIWRNTIETRRFVGLWLNLVKQRNLISDDSSRCGLPELPDFVDHRHDQALLNLCCLQESIRGLPIGESLPSFDSKNPDKVSSAVFNTQIKRSIPSQFLHCVAKFLSRVERHSKRRSQLYTANR